MFAKMELKVLSSTINITFPLLLIRQDLMTQNKLRKYSKIHASLITGYKNIECNSMKAKE